MAQAAVPVRRRRPCRDRATVAVHAPAITTEQAARVREIAFARAADLGLPPQQARVLADSVVGGLVTAGP